MVNGKFQSLSSTISMNQHVQFMSVSSAKSASLDLHGQLASGADGQARRRGLATASENCLAGGKRRGIVIRQGSDGSGSNRRWSNSRDPQKTSGSTLTNNEQGFRGRHGFGRPFSVEKARMKPKGGEREDPVAVSDEKSSKKVGSASGSSGGEGGGGPKKGFVERVEVELASQFGGVLWFSVLFIALAVFGGGYAYFILKYADYSDIPILRGPQR